MSVWQCSECGSTDTHKRSMGLCRKCYKKMSAKRRREREPEQRAEESKAYYQANREKILKRQAEKHRQLKWDCIEALGGKCACCGETALEFLTIDHINGDGASHRRTITGRSRASSPKIYKDIRNQGYPKDKYRVLCMNCNFSYGLWGYCPHTHTRETKYPIGSNPYSKKE